jgi:hypothetical protein
VDPARPFPLVDIQDPGLKPSDQGQEPIKQIEQDGQGRQRRPRPLQSHCSNIKANNIKIKVLKPKSETLVSDAIEKAEGTDEHEVTACNGGKTPFIARARYEPAVKPITCRSQR